MLNLPATADQWRLALGDTPLPILSASSQASQRLAGRPSLSSTQLARISQSDPSLSLHLLSRANAAMAKSRSPAAKDGVFSVAHGVSLLGVEGALQSVLALPTIDSLGQTRQREGLTATLAKAHLAGQLATHFSTGSQDRSRAGAQAHFLGELVGWHTADKPAEAFSAVWSRDPKRRIDKEREHFGISLMELSTLTANAVGLSHTLVAAEQNRQSAIAARVASAVSLGWNSEETRALKEQAAQYFGVSMDEINTGLHRVTVAAARSFPEPTAMYAARTLLLEQDNVTPSWYVSSEPIAVGATSRAAGLAPKSALRPVASVSSLHPTAAPSGQCNKVLADYLAKRSTINQMFQSLAGTMCSTLGFQRVVIALLNKRRDQLLARFSSETDDIYLGKFVVPLKPANLFSKLMEKPAGLLVDPGKVAKVQRQVPTLIESLLPTQGFCVMSLFGGARPVGVILGELSAQTNQDVYNPFKQICVEASKALATNANVNKLRRRA